VLIVQIKNRNELCIFGEVFSSVFEVRSYENAVEIPARLDRPKPKCSLQLSKDGRCPIGLSFDVCGELEVSREGDTKILFCFYKLESTSCARLAHKEISVSVDTLTKFAEFHYFAFVDVEQHMPLA